MNGDQMLLQPPPHVTKEDILFKDLVAAGVKEALLQHEENVSLPKLEKLLETARQDICSVASQSINKLTKSLELLSLEKVESLSSQLQKEEAKMTKQTYKLIKATTEKVPALMGQACAELEGKFDVKAQTIMTTKVDDISCKIVQELDKTIFNKFSEVENTIARIEEPLTNNQGTIIKEMQSTISHALTKLEKKLEDKVQDIVQKELGYLSPQVAHEVQKTVIDQFRKVESKIAGFEECLIKNPSVIIEELQSTITCALTKLEIMVQEDVEKKNDQIPTAICAQLQKLEKMVADVIVTLNKMPLPAEATGFLDDTTATEVQSYSVADDSESDNESDCFISKEDNIVEKQNTVQLSSLAELKKKIDARAIKQDEQRPGTSTQRQAPKRKAGSAQNDHKDEDDPPPKQTKICRAQTGSLSTAGPQDIIPKPTDQNNQEPTDDEMCAICLGPKIDKMTLQCDHSFCKICINKWTDFAGKCPICKRDVDICEVPF